MYRLSIEYDKVTDQLITRREGALSATAAGGGSREREKGGEKEFRSEACRENETTISTTGPFKSPLRNQKEQQPIRVAVLFDFGVI